MTSKSPRRFDVCVVGGGPAGSIAALRLALLGRRVCLFERSHLPRRQVGESLSAGIRPILESLNLLQLVLRRALTPDNSRVLWSQPYVDLLTTDRSHGWLLVDRGDFDALLLRAAAAAGVEVQQPATVREVIRQAESWRIEAIGRTDRESVEASYLIDASGRAGFRYGKRQMLSPRTMAVCGHLQQQSPAGDILVEALPDGWCWGSPVPDNRLSVMTFLDADQITSGRRQQLSEVWRARLAGTELFAGISSWPLIGPLLVRDASSYFTTETITDTFARVGEASYALDPLSSTGVEKAAQSATAAAFAIHTMLEDPSRTDFCLRFFRDRQQETVSAHRAWSSEFYGSVARFAEMRFWKSRSSTPVIAVQKPTASNPTTAASFTLQTMVRLSDLTEAVKEPCIVDNRLDLRTALNHPNLNRPVAFLDDVALWPLVQKVTKSTDVGNLIELWAGDIPQQKAHKIVQWLLDRRILESPDI